MPRLRPGPSAAGRLLSALAVAAVLTCAVAVLSPTVEVRRTVAGSASAAPAPAPAAPCGPGWVTGWMAAPQAVPADPALGGATLRMIVRPQVTGSEVRVRLSNAYGTAPLTVGAVSAARSDGAAAVVAATLREVTFGGQPSVTVPVGADVRSDPVPLVAEAGRPLAVSLFLPTAPAVVSGHVVALQTSYRSGSGDQTFAADVTDPTPLASWLVLTGVDVLAPRPVNAVVAIGDSITDGVGTDPDTDERWSDALSGRLTAAGGPRTMAVLNAGISRNRLLDDDPRRDGDSPLARFDRDVAAAAGATDVVLHAGTNDIASGRDADEVVAGLERFADRVRAAGRRVFLTTITPSTTGSHGTAAATATRDAVNGWVLGRGRDHADGVFDFAAAVADPVAPSRLAREYDAGDGLHLSAAGYRALAGAVEPAGLTGSPCLADSAPVRVVVSGR